MAATHTPVFQSGNSQAESSLPSDAGTIFDALSELPADFLTDLEDYGRDDTPPPQDRWQPADSVPGLSVENWAE